MKLNKPKFWDNRIGLLSVILYPISLIVIFIVLIRKKLVTKIEFGIPVICVGNIYLGGTGKTPVSIFIASELKKLGKKPVIIRKFYKSHFDEYNLIKKYFSDLIVHKNRSIAIKEAKNRNFDIVILDDGLQEYKIKKNLNIVCFNEKQLVGNGLVMPAGPLRENLNNLIKYKHVCINGNMENLDIIKHQINIINPNIKIHLGEYVPTNLEEFDLSKNYLAFSGIGNHQSFIKMLKNYNIKVINDIEFPDHYEYSDEEIQKLISIAKKYSAKIVTTEKDLNRIDVQKFNEIKIIKSKLNVINEVDFLSAIFKTNEQD